MEESMNVSIRRWQNEDASVIAEILNNKKITDNLRDGLPYPYTENDGFEFINAMLNADPNTTFAFAITVDGETAGSIGAVRQGNIHNQTAEMGYYISEKYWGKGVCTQAVKQLCAYMFENTDIIRIYAEPFADNKASCRVLEKAGFKYEGTLRSNAVKNGVLNDMNMYSLIRRPANDLSQMTIEELWFLFPIELKEYEPIWDSWYEEERSNLLDCAGSYIKQIDHIGSTAVKGLTAKPIVDILVQISDDCDIDRLKSILSGNGWTLMYDEPSEGIHSGWNKGYTINGFAQKVYHLHVRNTGDWDEIRFRDYLRCHTEAVKEYENIKHELADKFRNNRDAYTQAKGDFIKLCIRKDKEEI
jgi:RimJ/RimL family protein N-acetyltransferase/GrpB-like predicted nucleotidyltransferase (UPF0157 family)